MPKLFAGGLVFVALSLTSCASIVEGTDQSIAVALSPDSATCVVMRDGARLTTITKDHRFINISKSKNDLIIECQADGHHNERMTIESSASGWGVVGCIFIDLCITDYSTGALNKYPKTIDIALAPKSFDTAESRDEWYERRRRTLEDRWKETLSRKSAECDTGSASSNCRVELATLQKTRDEELQRLENRRLAAETSGGTQPIAPTSSVESRLDAAKDLYDKGVISRQEYEQTRREILSSI